MSGDGLLTRRKVFKTKSVCENYLEKSRSRNAKFANLLIKHFPFVQAKTRAFVYLLNDDNDDDEVLPKMSFNRLVGVD